mmetsp:Transcript_82483/g.229960  ORF Transcript_82483/g.229960 Transcript_82483/m.229960 type:complete len:259 (+) Transcript_82483:229-1005(+)
MLRKCSRTIVGRMPACSPSAKQVASLKTVKPSLPCLKKLSVQTRYRSNVSIGAPPTTTVPSTSLLPSGLAASKVNDTPLTCRKRPSNRGYLETPFSSTSNTWAPVSSKRHISSNMGRRLHKSRILKAPFSRMASARKVPLLSIAMSAFKPARMTSATKFPRLVSWVRMDEKRPSRSTAVSPRTLSMDFPTFAMQSSTSSCIVGSGVIDETISTCWVCNTSTARRPAPSLNLKRTAVMSRKSVPLFNTYVPCGPTGFTS